MRGIRRRVVRANGRWLTGALVAVAAVALAACGGPASMPTATPTSTATPTPTLPPPTPTPTLLAGWAWVEVSPEGVQSFPGGENSFMVALPPGWTATPEQGLDSFVGRIKGDGIEMTFDLGWYSSSLSNDGDPAYEVTFEQLAGREAKLVRSESRGVAGVYFADFGEGMAGSDFTSVNRLTVYGEGLTEEQIETAFAIFRTIR